MGKVFGDLRKETATHITAGYNKVQLTVNTIYTNLVLNTIEDYITGTKVILINWLQVLPK